jgi:hypothetical protein
MLKAAGMDILSLEQLKGHCDARMPIQELQSHQLTGKEICRLEIRLFPVSPRLPLMQ